MGPTIREHGVSIAIDDLNVRAEIFRTKRHPYVLHDLAAAIFESILRIRRDRGNTFVALIADPMP